MTSTATRRRPTSSSSKYAAARRVLATHASHGSLPRGGADERSLSRAARPVLCCSFKCWRATYTASGAAPPECWPGKIKHDDQGLDERLEVLRASGATIVLETCDTSVEADVEALLLRVRDSSTLADVRRLIDSRRSSSAPYELRTAFPNQAYMDPSQTLSDAGLTPNAQLMLRVAK